MASSRGRGKQPEGKSITKVDPNQLPAEIMGEVEAHAGEGVSTDQSDNIVPMVYVLQPLSPQVDQQSPDYIPGAVPGTIWLRNYMEPLVPGGEGIIFQPCFFSKDWPEWVPRERGGGFVARHLNRLATEADVKRLGPQLKVGEDMPDVEDATFVIDPKNRQKAWSNKASSNDLILTRSHAGYVTMANDVVLPYVIPLKGASHKVSRSWMFTMMSKRTPTGKIIPSYAFLYRLTTKQFQNPQGKWYAFEVAPAGAVPDMDAFNRGRDLFKAFESGEKVAEAEVTAGADVGDEDGAGAGETGGGDNIPY